MSVDDEPGFINRDRRDQGSTLYLDFTPDSEKDIQSKWGLPRGKKKRRKKQRKKQRKIEEMPKSSL